jgi:branched-chain amino acid transport system substrate-binding protein
MFRFALLLLAGCALMGAAHAQDTKPVRITVISDQDDDIYDARAGRGGVDATKMAVADFGGSVLGRPIVVDALNDHNKPALVTGLATQAIDAGADLLMDVQNAPIAAAVAKVAAERHVVAISTGSGIGTLTRAACSRYFYHYSFDSAAIESSTPAYLASLPDGKRWVALVADAGFGKGGLATMSPVIKAHGGEVVQSFILPPDQADVSAVLPQIAALHPDVVVVLNAGVPNDVWVEAVTKAALAKHVATGILYLPDVEATHNGYAGVTGALSWYWNQDAEARAWSDRFSAAHHGARPTAAQAADYSATLQWLKAVQAAGTTEGNAVTHTLDGTKFHDIFARNGEFRADHMVAHDMLAVEVVDQAKLTDPHGWFKVVGSIPAADAFAFGSECHMAP